MNTSQLLKTYHTSPGNSALGNSTAAGPLRHIIADKLLWRLAREQLSNGSTSSAMFGTGPGTLSKLYHGADGSAGIYFRVSFNSSTSIA